MKRGVPARFQEHFHAFPGVRALDNVSFTARSGEVTALLGENGAGKSTLLKILNGDYLPTEGTVALDGRELMLKSPHDAIGQESASSTRNGRWFPI